MDDLTRQEKFVLKVFVVVVVVTTIINIYFNITRGQ